MAGLIPQTASSDKPSYLTFVSATGGQSLTNLIPFCPSLAVGGNLSNSYTGRAASFATYRTSTRGLLPVRWK